MRRGEIWWATLRPPSGRRPVLLLSRDDAYGILTQVTVAPLTTSVRSVPSAVRLDPRADGVLRPSVVSLDNLLTIRVEVLDELVTRLRPEKLREVEEAIHFALGLSF